MLRSALVRPAAVVLSLVIAVAPGCARSNAASRSNPDGLAPAHDGARSPDGATSAPLTADEQRARSMADALRAEILDGSYFTDVGEPGCDGGALRTFKDSTEAGRQRVNRTFDRLERLVIARGVDTPLDTPDGHALLATVVAWEAGGDRPHWDVKPGGPNKRAIAPGLAGKFTNPATGKCESYIADDTTTFVIPQVANLAPPKLDSAKAVLYEGPEGMNKAREAFFSSVGARDSSSIFTYTRVRAAVIWGDYAVVAVNRPAERRGIQELPEGAGGASYIFHRAGGEWRLLAITRTWA